MEIEAAKVIGAGLAVIGVIGSGIGIQNKTNITLIKEQSSVPVIVDAGVGTINIEVLFLRA